MSSNQTDTPTTTPTTPASSSSSLGEFIPPHESAGVGNLLFLFIAYFLCGAVVFIGMKQYISFKRIPFYAIFFSFLGWFICFSIAYLVPIDIIVTDHIECEFNKYNNTNSEVDCDEPMTYLPSGIMKLQWRILYFGTLILSWLIFPILQSFSTAADFRLSERIKRSIKENIVLYTFMAIGGLIGVIVILSVKEMTPSSFLDFIMVLANVYGVVLIVITMGYGLIDVPRNLFRKGSHYSILRNYRVEAVVLKTELEDTRKKLVEHLKLIKTLSDRAGQYDPFRIYLDIIISKCPLEYDSVIQEYHADPLPAGADEEMLSYKKLVCVHSTLLDLVDRTHSAEVLYERLLGKAFAIEDIIESKQNIRQNPDVEKGIAWTFKPITNNKAEYMWHMYIFPYYYRFMGFICSCLSGIIVWSEIVLAVSSNPKYSPLYRVIVSSEPGIGLQIFCFIPLIYMCLCSYSTLFKLRISTYYRLVPQQTNTFSIMFSANYLCRLAAPLAFNFIQICHTNDNTNPLIKSPFDVVMGDMNAFGDNGIGKKFTVFFPIFVIVVCVISFFNLHKRIAASCCIQSLRIVTDTSEGAVDQGLKILKQEREERSLNGGVAPVKTRLNIMKDMFVQKKKGTLIPNQDGANDSPSKNIDFSNRYKNTAPKSNIAIANLSRTYTSKSGNVYSNQKEDNDSGSGSSINNLFSNILGDNKNSGNNGAILNSNKSTTGGKDKQSLISNFLNKGDFGLDDDDDDHTFDDIEMGAFKSKPGKK
ncbi:hypothetical protein DICPUDRAFT_55212 [Dictyostelium purpureum]|uniref:Uncharacterized protein n=1 Tax=Dictyostelium purpureum TaxID=5786 RepID=F0ZKX1_DICPU|nr:uncharacterized protein DICPUDRAFT_55212 [Dictyostelium purpureum]EGC35389.1 hypothetical protein DICPUDRAFT_55212 [Dictyostelium purpureum]|eukprot:XP_003288065.1 hypothetical protein DICPUDRAFT_55212 [Dictyostelium purpureum]